MRLRLIMPFVLGASLGLAGSREVPCATGPQEEPRNPSRAVMVKAWDDQPEATSRQMVREVNQMPKPAAHQAPANGNVGLKRNMLTNEGVVLLAQAGYTEAFILDLIYEKPTHFDVSPEGLAWLAQMGLTERIVRAMVANERKEERTAMVTAILSAPQPAPEPARLAAPQKTTQRKQGRSEPVAAAPAPRGIPVQVVMPRSMNVPGR